MYSTRGTAGPNKYRDKVCNTEYCTVSSSTRNFLLVCFFNCSFFFYLPRLYLFSPSPSASISTQSMLRKRKTEHRTTVITVEPPTKNRIHQKQPSLGDEIIHANKEVISLELRSFHFLFCIFYFGNLLVTDVVEGCRRRYRRSFVVIIPI